MEPEKFLHGSAELALTPGNGASFFKLEADIGRSWSLKNGLKFISFTRAGALFNLTQNPLYINDRFFSYFDLGFEHMGRTLPAIQTPKTIDANKVCVDDEPGASKFLNQQFRLQFTQLPGFKDMNLSAFGYSEFIYYPNKSHSLGQVLDQTRVSHGVGLQYFISPMLSIALYLNMGTFNAQKGDDPRTGGLSITFLIL